MLKEGKQGVEIVPVTSPGFGNLRTLLMLMPAFAEGIERQQDLFFSG